MPPALNGRARARSARASAQCVTAKKKGLRIHMVLLLLPWLRLLLLLQCLTFSSFARFPFHDSQVYVGWFLGSKSAPRRPKSDSNIFFSAPRASKRAPRGYQEAFGGLPRRRCDWEPILEPFWTRFWRPRPLKIEVFVREVLRFL